LKPILGGIKLDRLDALRVQSPYRAKLDTGLSPRTVQIIHTTLHKALKQAVRWLLIPRNVTEAVGPPRPSAKEVRPLSVKQVKSLLGAAKGDRWEALYVLAVPTGLRQGELLGLKWEDVDLQAGKVRVGTSLSTHNLTNRSRE
jgi:integrase